MLETEVEARAKKRLKADAVRKAVRWPKECPTCFSPVGDRCRTIAGVVTAEHIGRANLRPRARDMARYPLACPVCKRDKGESCVSLYTGKIVHAHRDRPTR